MRTRKQLSAKDQFFLTKFCETEAGQRILIDNPVPRAAALLSEHCKLEVTPGITTGLRKLFGIQTRTSIKKPADNDAILDLLQTLSDRVTVLERQLERYRTQDEKETSPALPGGIRK